MTLNFEAAEAVAVVPASAVDWSTADKVAVSNSILKTC